jgi:hypothetical protein
MRLATSIVLLMVAAPAAACGIGSIAEPELDAFDVAEVNGQVVDVRKGQRVSIAVVPIDSTTCEVFVGGGKLDFYENRSGYDTFVDLHVFCADGRLGSAIVYDHGTYTSRGGSLAFASRDRRALELRNVTRSGGRVTADIVIDGPEVPKVGTSNLQDFELGLTHRFELASTWRQIL